MQQALTYDLRLTTYDCSAPVWIEVDLEAVRDNFRQIRRALGPQSRILAVVKANAYGHGLLPVARVLTEAGADGLAVASVVEGVSLRQAGVSAPVLVLGQLLPEEAPLVVRHDLIQALGDDSSARALSRAACREEKRARFHLKVDTGMGRYGVWHEEAAPLLRQLVSLPGLRMEGVFTHLSSAGQDIPATEEQLSSFRRLIQRLGKARLPVGIRHVANSVGLIRFPDSHWDMVRTGLLLYGASPVREGLPGKVLPGLPIRIRPALSLKSRIRFLKAIRPGQTVSYGATFRADRPTRVATVPVGYAHGYMRALSNRAKALVRGQRAPVIGRVTMEDLMCDVTGIPGARVGEEVVLIGRQGDETVTAEELAVHARTIPYEILVGLSPSIPRFYP